ncbi:MRN complex-interacting protein isoform X5 [Balaenoptera ricei]|uniref:MRN complex-interacting protein isoform X5 n=1 Tax=Balaenoptera ricei TaxID=2746895 RepID=UPI0028BF214B|nr:MRN complex-interacting protein isoform X5 [Balaenoptera ricei]
MAPPQRVRVLRCSCCRLFQAHQVKKSLKWTCKACGEKQSFLRAYGEGSGADCRHHVQKLNLLQGQISEMSLRSLEESINADEEENARPRQPAPASLQEKLQPSKNRWLKYLEKDSKELELEEGGVCFNRQPSSKREKPDPPFSTGLPRKRKWSQSTVQPPCSPNVQDSRNCEVTFKSLKDRSLHPAWSTGSLSDCSAWDLPLVSEELSPSFIQAPRQRNPARHLSLPRPNTGQGHPGHLQTVVESARPKPRGSSQTLVLLVTSYVTPRTTLA